MMTFFKHATCVAATAILCAGCQPVDLLNTITPGGSFSRLKDVSYGELSRQTLDIYKAEKPRAGSPVLVFVHGGSWDSGSKDIYKFLAEGFTSEGFDVVVPDYRLYPEVKNPEFIIDNAKAVAYAAEQFPDRSIVMMGHSAGAYNVLMLGLQPDYLKSQSVNICETVSGIVALAAPVGIIPLTEEPLITIFPDRFEGQDAVLNNTSTPVPALFLGHGQKDKTVYPQNSTQLGEKITARGGKAEVEIYEGLNHTDMVKVMSRHFDGDTTLKSDIVRFVENLPRDGGYCK